MSNNYFNSTGTIGFICDVCGRELQSCTWISGMRFCAKCYQETFGVSKDWQLLDKDKTIAEQRKQIADLEAKLAESESKRKGLEEKVKFLTEEKEENFVDGQKYNELKQQLAEKEKLLKKYLATSCPIYQDKISFAVEQLEKVKNMLPEENIPIYPYEILCKLINQIEELKKEMK